MKRFYFTLLVSLFAFQIFASDLVLIPTKNYDETKSYFKNPALTVNFYKDEFIIATLDGDPKTNFVVLDQNPWEENYSYYLVYIDETVNRSAYYKKINQLANVLHDGGTYLILRIDETMVGQLPPAKNDGTVRISNKQVVLPTSIFYNKSGRWDPDPFVVSLLEQVSGTDITATIQHLQDYGTRNCYKPESIEAQNWIKEQFENLGLSVELQDFSMPNGPASDNVIATLVGTKYPDEFVVLGGHFDSITYSGLEPGADDNASGTSGVMEIARILSQYEFDRTIIFCAFSGEEYGLYGSEAYADRCASEGMNIHGYFNMDMIGYLEEGSYIHTDLMYPSSAQELADFYTDVCSVYLPDFPVEVGTLIGGDSDHTSFNNAGFMGIFPFEDGGAYSPYIHTSNDIIGPSFNNEDQAVIFTEAILASVVTMANRLTPPQNLVGIPGDGEVDLNWDNMLDIDNFNIYKDGDLIASTTDLFYHDENVMNGTQYEYYITAIYSDTGDESDPSNEILVTPMPPIGLPLMIDFESGAPYWDFEDTWGVSTSTSHSPSHSITESPGGEYGNNLEIYATLNSVNLSGYTDAALSFWTKYALESGYDYMWLEISTNGSTWIELDEFNGTQNSWQQKTYSLDDYLGEPYVVIRFHFYSDGYVTEDGMYIDDFEIDAEGAMMSQNIVMPEGWTSLSSYILPEAEQIEDVLASIADDIVIVQDMQNAWWPVQSINTIGNWNSSTGYKIKVSEEVSLQMAGYEAASKTINLAQGWNLMPVLSNNPVSCESLFSAVLNDLTLVKEVAGYGVYWPEEDITSLNNLMSGKAYLVHVKNAVSITFAENVPGTGNNKIPLPINIREGWELTPPTGNSHVIAVPASQVQNFELDDQIGVFNQEGLCTGFIEIEDLYENMALVACGNDSVTASQDGMMDEEMMNFRMFRSSTNEDFTLTATFDQSMPNQGYYVNEGLSKLETLQIDYTGISEQLNKVNIHPNPSSGVFHIMIDQAVNITVMSAMGQTVLSKVVDGNFDLDLSGQSKGVYFLNIETENSNVTKKLIVK